LFPNPIGITTYALTLHDNLYLYHIFCLIGVLVVNLLVVISETRLKVAALALKIVLQLVQHHLPIPPLSIPYIPDTQKLT
jgi:hypothetical protein